MLRVGHKGADAIRPGNTVESFTAAVEAGVDMIELDVLRPRADFADAADWKRAPAGPVRDPGGPLLVAHDWGDARRRDPMTLAQGLDAFAESPLDRVRIDLDLKVAGREDEVVGALAERGLLERAAISTMETSSLRELRRIEPDLRLGWTLPRIRRDWSAIPWAKPMVIAGLVSLRRRLPRMVRSRARDLGIHSLWAYHPVIGPRLVAACRAAELELIAWTVDELGRMRELVDLGVDGLCTNDPRLFSQL